MLGRVYEYFLGQFADAEGKKGGQFYTPRSIVRLLVAMIEPFQGESLTLAVAAAACLFKAKNSDQKPTKAKLRRHLSIYGQESNQTTWRLCKMNLAIRHIDSQNVVWNSEGSFLNDAHKDLKADYLLANPPFNDQRLERRLATR